MCRFDIVSSFGFVHHPQQQNNTPRPLPQTAIVVLREQKSGTFYVSACRSLTNEARVNKSRLSVLALSLSHIVSAVNKEEIMERV